MGIMKLEKEGAVFVLTLTNGEAGNLLNTSVLEEYNLILDEVEKTIENSALVITSDHHKTFCNGIDLIWLMQQVDPMHFITSLENFLFRLALLNIPVISAINGNAYGGGALIAIASDFRIMRGDQGRFCFPEINIKLPFTAGFWEIIHLLPSQNVKNDLVLTGDAWGGDMCAQRGVVHQAVSTDQVRGTAIDLAKELATKDRSTYVTLKYSLRSSLTHFAKLRGILS